MKQLLLLLGLFLFIGCRETKVFFNTESFSYLVNKKELNYHTLEIEKKYEIRITLDKQYKGNKYVFEVISKEDNNILIEGGFKILKEKLSCLMIMGEMLDVDNSNQNITKLSYFQAVQDGLWSYFDSKGKLLKLEQWEMGICLCEGEYYRKYDKIYSNPSELIYNSITWFDLDLKNN